MSTTFFEVNFILINAVAFNDKENKEIKFLKLPDRKNLHKLTLNN
jgi:hypothetical protein